MEATHNELEQYHYRGIRNNPAYALQCQQELYLEEMQMNAPVVDPVQPAIKADAAKRLQNQIDMMMGHLVYLQRQLAVKKHTAPKTNYRDVTV